MLKTCNDQLGKKIYQSKEELEKIKKITSTKLRIKTTHFNLYYLKRKNTPKTYDLKGTSQKINIMLPFKIKYKGRTIFNKYLKIGELPIPNKYGNFTINGNDRTVDMNNKV